MLKRPEEVFAAADARAQTLAKLEVPWDVAAEKLRAEIVAFFERIPEPPVYHRVEDPLRERAEALVPQGEELLGRAFRLQREAPSLGPLVEALKAYVSLLCQIAAGKIEAGETAWRNALELQRDATAAARVWRRSDESPPPVYDRASGLSRYDARDEPSVTVKLACPHAGCQVTAGFAFSPRHATHRFFCATCKRPFVAYFAEAIELVVNELSGRAKHHVFRVEELTGQRSKVEFDEASGAVLSVARRDLLAFLYTEDRELHGVVNLTSSRLLWVKRAGPCFVASVAFGENARELETLRWFRDEVLRRYPLGSALVRSYYRRGPALVEWLARRPRGKAIVRWMLQRMERSIRWWRSA
ncbi:MAG: CFI-box-CTERM domain-containing protein [Myxococcaceae bacterium]